MTPLLSIVIASYNHAQFIGEAIRSILTQPFQDFEIVITDDASPDDSIAAIRQFSDSRINLEVFPKNRGFAAALNASIRRSRGAFISVLGSDDYFLPGAFTRQIEFLRANADVAAVFGMPRFIDEVGTPLGGDYREFKNPFPDKVPTRKDWLRFFFLLGNCLCHPGAMIRRQCHDELGLYDPRLVGLADFDMWVRLCMVHEIHVMPDEIVARRIRENNKNLSATRPDTILRTMFEWSQILRHYRAIPPEIARAVFAEEVRALQIDTNRPFGIWLGELALRRGLAAHNLFAVETMFDACETAPDECARLIEVTGTVDVFNLARRT